MNPALTITINMIQGQEKIVNELTKIFNIFKASECEIRPHFILTGPSGSGKSFTIQTLCEAQEVGFLEINAAQLTAEGTSGNSLSKALAPAANFGGKPSVVFVDEFDKLFISGNSNSQCATQSRTEVQNEFLKVLESDTVSVFGDYGKYNSVNAKNILFIFAGAFNGEENVTIDKLRDFGVKTEFLGRVGLVYNTQKLTLEDMYKIIDNSVLLQKYCQLFEDVDFEHVGYLLKAQIKIHFENNTLGVRLLNTLIHQYFIKGGFTEESVKEVTFSKKLKL